jgi:osmotically-inducible protein OsmY
MTLSKWNALPLLTLLTLGTAPVFAAPQSTTPPDKDKNVVVKSKDVVVKDTKAVADATKDGLSKTGEVMTDTWVTTRVAARFVDEPLLKDSNINVDTSKHIVTLKGTVMAQAGRVRAADVARRTEGVHRVVNHLTIGPKKS